MMHRKKKAQILSLFLTVCLFLLSGATAVPAMAGGESASTPAKDYVIVALGDSITAGYEPGMKLSSVPYGYVERLKEQALFHGRTKAINYGILGLTSGGLNSYVKAIKEGKPVSADDIQAGLKDPRIGDFASGVSEAKATLEKADLITITIGGNDLLKLLPDLKNISLDQLRTEASGVMKSYGENIREVISILTELNPSAQIVLADQYQPVPKLAGVSIYDELNKVKETFTKSVDETAAKFTADSKKVKAAHIAEAFVGNEMSLTHIYSDGDIHPNQSGYETIAKVMAETIWGSYLDTAAKSGAAPISIVVKGQELKSVYAPKLKNNQTFVPIKEITNAIGAKSNWDSRKGTAAISYNGKTVVIKVGSKKITVDGQAKNTASPAFLSQVGGEIKTYVPLAVLVQGLGLDVQYSGKMKTVFINL
ncbi:stalk domain-containing protein [Paenibacillus puldeungensis]|uniref:Stalk domain-containing protein n=1 Tax=Paenibacillus puldeungensis TaxID=696536 RepID=A0ABW3RY89_9BACL